MPRTEQLLQGLSLALLLTACGSQTLSGITPADASAVDVSGPDVVTGFDAGARDVHVTVDTPPTFDLPEFGDVPLQDVPLMDDAPTEDVSIVPIDVPGPDVSPPADAGVCTLPLEPAITLPTDSWMGMLSGPVRMEMTCAPTGGPEAVFPLHITATTGIVLSNVTTVDTVMTVRTVCDDPTTDIFCDDDTPEGTAALIRQVLSPGDYFVTVGQYGNGMVTGGPLTLNVSTYTPASNASCTTPATLTPGTAVTANVTQGGDATNGCLPGDWGPELFYQLTIPAGQRATVTDVPTGSTGNLVVRILSNCDDMGCLADGDTGATAATGASAVYDNRGSTPLSVIVTVASTSARTGGPSTLTATLSASPPLPTNATCSTATAVTASTTLHNQDPTLADVRLDGDCSPDSHGAVLFYQVTLPGNGTMVATATADMGSRISPVLRVLANCTATTCSDDTPTLTYTNPTATTQTVILAVGAADPARTGNYDLDIQIVPPPTNTTCTSAATLTTGAHLADQNAGAGTQNATSTCLSTDTGTVLYYLATVPAGQTLDAEATPLGGMIPVVRLFSGCSATTCLASNAATTEGSPAHASWTNAGTTPATVYVAVGGSTNANNGIFTLDATIAREYTETTIPAACDSMTGATPLASVVGDDVASPVTDLPFPVTFYGATQLEYSMTTNGLLQLFPSVAGAMSNNAYNNLSIPSTTPPFGFIAPFWDDLISGTSSPAYIQTFGTAPNRHITWQWTSFQFYDDRTAAITFQAKVFEGTNVIEMHYCTLTPGTMPTQATGGSATIGIESPDGTLGTMHSFNTPMSVSTANGLRYSP